MRTGDTFETYTRKLANNLKSRVQYLVQFQDNNNRSIRHCHRYESGLAFVGIRPEIKNEIMLSWIFGKKSLFCRFANLYCMYVIKAESVCLDNSHVKGLNMFLTFEYFVMQVDRRPHLQQRWYLMSRYLLELKIDSAVCLDALNLDYFFNVRIMQHVFSKIHALRVVFSFWQGR